MRTRCLISATMVWLLSAAASAADVADAFASILPVTDPAMKRSLNGVWSLKVVDGIADAGPVPARDSTWRTIAVPGCWEAHGFCQPSYDRAQPLTGYYRTSFALPDEWRGQRIALRFDGVLYGYDLWVNGRHAGSWQSAYNTALFDITDCLDLSAPRQELAMRVVTQFAGSDFDYNDDWAPSGIVRDVTLMAVPATHLADLVIHTRNTGEVDVGVQIVRADRHTAVEHEIVDAQGRVVSTDKVAQPHLWTAETPYLYTLRTTLLKGGKVLQTFEHKFGFRELTIDGGVLCLNGRPVKLRGVTTHATDPHTGKVISDSLTLKDMRLMKEASVNCIRTSHYPREPRFYELADSLGFYIIDEVPFGYGDANLADTTFYPMLQQRAQATVRRDKNHPSVIIWSLGNENPLTDICIRLGHYVKTCLDPSRPICYPQVGSYFRRLGYHLTEVADIYAPHYPTTGQIAGFYQQADRPVIFTEYLHSLGVSFEDHDRQWELIERTPCIAGGFVWEWVDQGMPFGSGRDGARADRYGYVDRVYTSAGAGYDMNGNKGADGLLYADRTPLPGYYELQHNYAQAAITDSIITPATDALHIRNRFDFLNLKDNITFHWVLTADRDTIAQGAFSPYCPPRHTIAYPFCLPMTTDTCRVCLLHVTVSDAQGRITGRQTIPVTHTHPTERLLAALTVPTTDPMGLVQNGMLVRAGRKASMAEQLKVGDRRLERYLLPLTPDGRRADGIRTDIRTERTGNAMHYTFTLTPDTTDTFYTELGIAFLLDPLIDRVQWIGQGPLPTYPGRFRAGRYGFWALQQGDLYFEGNRRGVDAALLTDSDGNGLLLMCHNGNVSFEQTDRGIVLTYNAAVSGQGPKFQATAFPAFTKKTGSVSGSFYLYRIHASAIPQIVSTLFVPPSDIPAPFHPFVTQYDTYLMRFDDIVSKTQRP